MLLFNFCTGRLTYVSYVNLRGRLVILLKVVRLSYNPEYCGSPDKESPVFDSLVQFPNMDLNVDNP